MWFIEGSDKVSKELEDYAKDVKKRLINVATGFAFELADAASYNTPLGNQDDIDAEKKGYYSLYLDRFDDWGISPRAGFHSGAWVYSKDPNIEFDRMIGGRGGDDALYLAESNYKLGDTYYIGAKGPGFEALEGGSSLQAPEGIMKPTESQITSAFAIDVKKYYDMN